MIRRFSGPLRRACLGGVAALTALCTLTLLGCEPEFDPPSKLNTLRVLAVKADKPYPKPGDTVNLEMLWYDGKSQPMAQDGGTSPARKVEILWIGGCFNPAGDLYYGCYSQLGELFSSGGADPATAQYLGAGDSFSFKVPTDIISSRPTKEGVEPYGLAYVFFAACAGKIGPSSKMNFGLPLGCFDEQGKELGADDFVPGYFSLYSYDKYTNSNPVVTGFDIRGAVAEGNELSLPVCASSDCPEYEIQALIEPASAEVDPAGTGPNGEPLTEQMWVNYYASDGKIASGAKLVNDATKGWNDKSETKFQAPRERKTVSLFAVVHDNRGGVAWTRRDVKIQ